MAKTMKTLELRYRMIQFLIILIMTLDGAFLPGFIKVFSLSHLGLAIDNTLLTSALNLPANKKINKLTSAFYASVLLLIMNFVITLSK